ncbi:hypothetical protein M8J76_009439 [Diaphorina citri]|nr:hypothetical protein M8J76_009439 [Diaphorina citri]
MSDLEDSPSGKARHVPLTFKIRKEPPSAPQNLTVNFVDQSTVTLSWNPPNFQGGRTDTVYKVVCDACGPSVTYMPSAVSSTNR